VTSFSLCLLLVCAAEPDAVPAVRLYDFSPRFAAAIRGQDPGTFVAPSTPATPAPGTPTLEGPVPMTPDLYDPFQAQPQNPMQLQDPFLSGPDPVLSSPGLMAPVSSGGNGLPGFRFGPSSRFDIGYIPESDIQGINAGVEMFETDSELRYNGPLSYGWVYSTAGQFDYRAWSTDGVIAPAFGRLNLYRFGWDMQLFTPEVYGWQWQFGFNPSINTDFGHSLNNKGWNFDGSLVAYYRVDPILQLALGVTVWDRIDTFVLPYAGVIITPGDRWEFRLLFPKTRVSYLLGQCCDGSCHWLYLTNEFRVESYEFDLPGVSPGNAIQYEDWRLALGLRSDHGWFDKYIEVAWVYGRDFEFRTGVPNVDVDDSVLIRAGIRY